MSQAEYMKDYRSTPKGKQSLDRQKKRARAKARAFARLASLHHREFQDILREELREAGL